MLIRENALHHFFSCADFGSMEFQVGYIGVQMATTDDSDENSFEIAFAIVQCNPYVILAIQTPLQPHIQFRVGNRLDLELVRPARLDVQPVSKVFLNQVQRFMYASLGILYPENTDRILGVDFPGFVGVERVNDRVYIGIALDVK